MKGNLFQLLKSVVLCLTITLTVASVTDASADDDCDPVKCDSECIKAGYEVNDGECDQGLCVCTIITDCEQQGINFCQDGVPFCPKASSENKCVVCTDKRHGCACKSIQAKTRKDAHKKCDLQKCQTQCGIAGYSPTSGICQREEPNEPCICSLSPIIHCSNLSEGDLCQINLKYCPVTSKKNRCKNLSWGIDGCYCDSIQSLTRKDNRDDNEIPE